MSFVRTRTIKGRKYYSLEERYRGANGKVKSRFIRALKSASYVIGINLQSSAGMEFKNSNMLREDQHLEFEKKTLAAAEDAKNAELHERYGLKVGPDAPTPIEK